MKTPLEHFITIRNKKHSYTLRSAGKGTTLVECESANIEQEFLNEDIPGLLSDLPDLILAEKKHKSQSSEMIRFRISSQDKKTIERKAIQKGYASLSSYLRDLSLGKVA